jgi:hypothetical protein
MWNVPAGMGTMPYGIVMMKPSRPGTPTNSPWSPPRLPPPIPNSPQALAAIPATSNKSFEDTDLFIFQLLFCQMYKDPKIALKAIIFKKRLPNSTKSA